MTVIDFHPEDLLEREDSGSLSASEQRRLEEHVARCASCRIERQLRRDFERELGPQAAPDMLPALVAGALHAARAPRGLPAAGLAPRARARGRGSRRPLAGLLAAGVVLGAGLAAARPDVAVRALAFASQQLNVLLGQQPPHRAAVTPLDEQSEAPPLSARESDPPQAALQAAAPPEPPVHERKPDQRSKESNETSDQAGLGPRTEREQSQRSRGRGPVGLLPEKGAAGLFDRANAARRGGSGSEALYAELRARFPDSPEARLSEAILGRMKLDAGDAAAAVSHFEAYLSTGDQPLREQAMAGCALAWGKLGRADRERQSWRALLAAYPESSYAALAWQRLAREAP